MKTTKSDNSIFLFRRPEGSLFAQGHVKMISFFSRPWLPYPSVFLLFKSNFLRPYRSDLFEFYINNTTGSRSSIFQIFGGQNFSPASCWRRQPKTQVFSEGKCYFVALLWPNIPWMVSRCWLWDEKWNFKCIQFLAKNPDFSRKFWPRIFWEKSFFKKNFCKI